MYFYSENIINYNIISYNYLINFLCLNFELVKLNHRNFYVKIVFL